MKYGLHNGVMKRFITPDGWTRAVATLKLENAQVPGEETTPATSGALPEPPGIRTDGLLCR